MRHRDFLVELETEVLGIVRRPARGRDLDHANVVESTLGGIGFRVLPDGDHLRVADGAGPGSPTDLNRLKPRMNIATAQTPLPKN